MGTASKISWGEKIVKKPRRFKGRQDGKYLINVLSQPYFDRTHYVPEFGYIRCLGGRGKCPLCDGGHFASDRYGLSIAVFDLDSSGNPVNPVSFKVYPWIVGVSTIQQLQDIYQENGDFSQYDLKINCTNERSQQWQITPKRTTVLESTEVRRLVMDEYKMAAIDLSTIMAEDYSYEKMAQIAVDNPPEPRRGRGGQQKQSAPKEESKGSGKDVVNNIVGGGVPHKEMPKYEPKEVAEEKPKRQVEQKPYDYAKMVQEDLGGGGVISHADNYSTVSAEAQKAKQAPKVEQPVEEKKSSNYDDLISEIMAKK